MTPDEFQSKLTGITVEINRAVNHDLPLIVGNKAVDMFKQNFQEEGFFGGKWKDVKRRSYQYFVATYFPRTVSPAK